MAVSGNNLLVAGFNNNDVGNLVAFDISAPSTPVQRGSLSFPSPSGWDPAFSVAATATKAVVGMNAGALKIIDISNINSLVERGPIIDIGFPRDVAITADENYTYVIDGNANSRLKIVDVSNPLSPSLVTELPLGTAGGQRLTLQGNQLYAVTTQGVFVFDISNSTWPVLIRSYPFGGATSVALDNNTFGQRDVMYLASLDGGFAVLKNKDVEAPTVFVTNPTFSAAYTNTSGTLNLGGSASDNVGVTRIAWANDRGGAGEAVGAEDWFVSNIALYPGTNVLTVRAFDQAGNANSATLTVVYQSAKQSQTITFPELADKTFGEGPIALSAAASSGLPVGFSVLSGPASLSNNALTLIGAGSVTVRATQTGDDQFNAAPPVDRSFNVAKTDQAITFAPVSDKLLNDAPFAVSATASSGLPVTFSIISGPASMNGNVVTLSGGGVVTVRATQPGNMNFNAALDVDRDFVVKKTPAVHHLWRIDAAGVRGRAIRIVGLRDFRFDCELFGFVRSGDCYWKPRKHNGSRIGCVARLAARRRNLRARAER